MKKIKKSIYTLIAFVILSATQAFAWPGKVIRVVDGDTIGVMRNRGRLLDFFHFWVTRSLFLGAICLIAVGSWFSPTVAQDCPVPEVATRIAPIHTEPQTFSGVLTSAEGPKDIEFHVSAGANMEIEIVISRSSWRLRERPSIGVYIGEKRIWAVWDAENPSLYGKMGTKGTELIHGFISAPAVLNTMAKLRIKSAEEKISYRIRIRPVLYGDAGTRLDTGGRAETALPISPATVIEGNFTNIWGGNWTLNHYGVPFTSEFTEEFTVPTESLSDLTKDQDQSEKLPQGSFFWDKTDIYRLRNVPSGSKIIAKLIDTESLPTGMFWPHSIGPQFGFYIDILRPGCDEDGNFILLDTKDLGGGHQNFDNYSVPAAGDYFVRIKGHGAAKYWFRVDYKKAPVNFILTGSEFRMISGNVPEKPPIGSPVFMGFRLRNLPDYWMSGLSLTFQFSDLETGKPIDVVKGEMEEDICKSVGRGAFACAITDMRTGGHKDFLFSARMPESSIRWRAVWNVDDGSLDPGTASGVIESDGKPRILDVFVLSNQEQERYGIPSFPYPFVENGRSGLDFRTLFVVGYKLPQESGDDVRFISSNPAVEYRFIAFTDTTNSFHKETYEAGWAAYRANAGLKPDDPLPAGLKGFLIRANLHQGIMPGFKKIQYKESVAPWELFFGGLGARVVIVNRGGNDEIGSTYPPGYVEVLITPDIPLPIKEVPLVIYEDHRNKPGAKAHKILARLDKYNHNSPSVYRSSPILLMDPSNANRPPVGRDTLVIPVSLGGVGPVSIRAEVEGNFRSEKFAVSITPVMAQINILKDPRDEPIAIALEADRSVPRPTALFNQALQVAAACKDITIRDFGSLDLQNREAGYFWNVVLLKFFDKEIRTTDVTIGHHAAMLLMLNVYVEFLKTAIREIRLIRNDDKLVLAFLKRMSAHFGERDFAINRLKVTTPDEREIEYRYAGAFDNDEFLAQQYNLGKGEEGRKKAFQWRLDATKEALGKLQEQTSEILKEARELNTCENIQELVRLTGSGFDVIIWRLEPMLRKLTQMNDSITGERWTEWEKDINAGFWLNDIKLLLEKVKRQEGDAKEDTALLLGLAAVLSIPVTAGASSIPYIAFAIGALDLAATSYFEISEYLRTNAEVEFSEKAAIVLGYERNAKAERAAKHWASMMSIIGLSSYFAGLDTIQMIRAIRSVKNVARGMEVTRSLAVRGINSLSRIERRHFATFAMRARMRQIRMGLENLSQLEQRAIAEVEDMARLHEATTTIRPPVSTPRPAPVNNIDIVVDLETNSYSLKNVTIPRAADPGDLSPIMQGIAEDLGSDAFYIRMSDLFNDGQPPTIRLTTEEFGRNLEGSTITFVNLRGHHVTIRVGDYIASGAFSAVLKEPVRPAYNRFYRRVIKITIEQPPEVAGVRGYDSFRPDEAGRRAILSLPTQENIRVPRRHPADVHRIRTMEGPLENQRVLVVQIMGEVPAPACTLWRRNGGRLSPRYARSTFNGLKDLNDQGYAWVDNKTNNFSFELIEGRINPRMIAFDTGGIIQMKGSTLAIRAARARQVQRLVNGPFDEFLQQEMSQYRPLLSNLSHDLQRAYVRRFTIANLFNDLVDLEPLGVQRLDHLGFNPIAGEQLPNVRQYFEDYGVPIRSADDVVPDIP